MAPSYETLICKIEELAVSRSGKCVPVRLTTLAKHTGMPMADIVVMLHEMEKWKLLKMYIPDGRAGSSVNAAEVIMLLPAAL